MLEAGPDIANAKLLWTGGWDSTFQLLTLLLTHKRSVTPIYLIDTNRPSCRVEIVTIERIKKRLFRDFPYTRDLLKETLFFSVEDVLPDLEITRAFKSIIKAKSMGCQYEWLARFCKQHSFYDVQLGVHRDDKAHVVIEHMVSEDHSGFYINQEHHNTEEHILFRYFKFPLLELSKVDIAAIANEQGWSEIMEMTWFCHTPTRTMKPCGRCNPCVYTIEEGLGLRIPMQNRLSGLVVRLVIRPVKSWFS
jgi:hypothetical protein